MKKSHVFWLLFIFFLVALNVVDIFAWQQGIFAPNNPRAIQPYESACTISGGICANSDCTNLSDGIYMPREGKFIDCTEHEVCCLRIG